MAELVEASGFQELTPEQLSTGGGALALNNMLRILFRNMPSTGEGVKVLKGYGSPENNFSAQVGSIYQRLDGGANTTLYIKESGDNTNTGWAAK